MNDADAIKVLIVNEHGQYLAGTASHWDFTEDRIRARVFDFHKDEIPEQLALVRKIYGIIWTAVKLDPSQTNEFCDRCGTRMTALQAVFDGTEFLCRECQTSANPSTSNDNVANCRPANDAKRYRRDKGEIDRNYWNSFVPSIGNGRWVPNRSS